MPIRYQVSHDGHSIHAVASGTVSPREFADYEVAHAIDDRIVPPVAELLVVEYDALKGISREDMRAVLDRRAELGRGPTPHRCGIVVSYGDTHSWNLAKFYEGMVILHFPENVVVFGDERLARLWLGIDGH